MFAEIRGSTELDTTRWIMKFSEVLEALDSANPDGVSNAATMDLFREGGVLCGFKGTEVSLIINVGVRYCLVFVNFCYSYEVASTH